MKKIKSRLSIVVGMINVNESGHSMSIVTIVLNDPSNNILTINPRFIKFVTHIITIAFVVVVL